jgi:hypothetical protein
VCGPEVNLRSGLPEEAVNKVAQLTWQIGELGRHIAMKMAKSGMKDQPYDTLGHSRGEPASRVGVVSMSVGYDRASGEPLSYTV